MIPILLAGGGGHCRSCIDVIEAGARYAIQGIVQPAYAHTEKVLGYSIVGTDQDIAELISGGSHVLITVGQIKSPTKRIKLYEYLKSINASLPAIVSPRAYVSAHAGLAEGCIVMHGAIINAAATVAENCIINSKALVEHDAVIKRHCHISTGVSINGGVVVGEGCFIGSGSVLREGVKVGAGVVIGAGQIVLGDVPEGTILRGVK
jgi:sugar O-acyltransferase (sialic acid O-acetyltransferase NeuD family)